MAAGGGSALPLPPNVVVQAGVPGAPGVSGKSLMGGIPFPGDNDDNDNDEDEEEEIFKKQQRMRQERAARQASARTNPLSFGLDNDAAAGWSLADTFRVNSTLIRAVFMALQDATQLLTKAEMGLSGLACVLRSKMDQDIKTTQVYLIAFRFIPHICATFFTFVTSFAKNTFSAPVLTLLYPYPLSLPFTPVQRALDFVGRRAGRDSGRIEEELARVVPGMLGMLGALEVNSSTTGLALLRAGVSPLESGFARPRLLASVAAASTQERAGRVRKRRRSASATPALLAATQENYRGVKTLPSKLAYDFGRKKALSPGSATGVKICIYAYTHINAATNSPSFKPQF